MLCLYTSSQNGQVIAGGLSRWSVRIKVRDKTEVPFYVGQSFWLSEEKAKIIQKLPANGNKLFYVKLDSL